MVSEKIKPQVIFIVFRFLLNHQTVIPVVIIKAFLRFDSNPISSKSKFILKL